MSKALKVAVLSALFAAGLAAATAAPAFAQTYNFSGQLVDSDVYSPLYDDILGTISGTFTINSTTGEATSLTFTTVSDSSQIPSDTYSEGLVANGFSTDCCQSTLAAGDDQLFENAVSSNGNAAQLDLIFPAGGGSLSQAGFAHSFYNPLFYPDDTTGAPYIVGSVSEAVSAAPEPGAWALMIAGVAMVGGRLRYAARSRLRPALAA